MRTKYDIIDPKCLFKKLRLLITFVVLCCFGKTVVVVAFPSMTTFSSQSLKPKVSQRQDSISWPWPLQGRVAFRVSTVHLPQLKQSGLHRNIKTTFTSIHSSNNSSSNQSVDPKSNVSDKKATAVFALMLCNLAVFLLDKVFRYRVIARQLYLFHYRWKWWQPLTSCFCHVDRSHLSNNLFLLLLFGRSVEDDLGWGGLLLSYVFCGVVSSLVSISLLPKNAVSIGASGAVFGLFTVSTLAKLSWKDLDWRKVVEVSVLGEFVFRQITSEISTAAGGGMSGINHVAHLSGAAAGAILVYGMRTTVARFDRAEEAKRLKKDNQ